jgi:HSP20 family protein
MSLIRWEPMTELRRLQEEMDRLFESFMRPFSSFAWPVREAVAPPVDVYEKDGNVIVKAELPGLKKEDIEITATEDSISLRGEFKREEEVKKEGFYRHERREGKFYRTIPMPVPIKPDEVKATFKDGVLEITAPEVEEARPKERKVPIEA